MAFHAQARSWVAGTSGAVRSGVSEAFTLGGIAMQGPEQQQAQPQIQGAEGLVKWFDPRKGFGFIVGPEGQDIFVHYTVINGDGFRVLKDGSKVGYDAVMQADRRWKATRVVRVDTAVEVTVQPRRGYTRSPRR